jgi:hypothetical protein
MKYLNGSTDEVLFISADDRHVVKWCVDALFAVHADSSATLVAQWPMVRVYQFQCQENRKLQQSLALRLRSSVATMCLLKVYVNLYDGCIRRVILFFFLCLDIVSEIEEALLKSTCFSFFTLNVISFSFSSNSLFVSPEVRAAEIVDSNSSTLEACLFDLSAATVDTTLGTAQSCAARHLAVLQPQIEANGYLPVLPRNTKGTLHCTWWLLSTAYTSRSWMPQLGFVGRVVTNSGRIASSPSKGSTPPSPFPLRSQFWMHRVIAKVIFPSFSFLLVGVAGFNLSKLSKESFSEERKRFGWRCGKINVSGLKSLSFQRFAIFSQTVSSRTDDFRLSTSARTGVVYRALYLILWTHQNTTDKQIGRRLVCLNWTGQVSYMWLIHCVVCRIGGLMDRSNYSL